jgi:hypothetical protein
VECINGHGDGYHYGLNVKMKLPLLIDTAHLSGTLIVLLLVLLEERTNLETPYIKIYNIFSCIQFNK